jgi:hypothetical protein
MSPVWQLYQWEGRRYRERVKEGESVGNSMYSYMIVEK